MVIPWIKQFLCVLFTTWACCIQAQQPSYKLYTPHDGMVQSQVQYITQDSRGYIWLGTQGGVSYFDGVKFHNLTKRDGLPHQVVLNIAEDIDSTMWFLTKNFISHYDGNSITTDTIPGVMSIAPGLFCIDKSGTKWVVDDATNNLLFNTKKDKTWQNAKAVLKVPDHVFKIHYLLKTSEKSKAGVKQLYLPLKSGQK
jgi:ligand-binding sensor domain-containing protein